MKYSIEMKESQFQAFLKERKAELMEEGATDIYKQVRAEWKAYKATLPQKPKGPTPEQISIGNGCQPDGQVDGWMYLGTYPQ